MADVFTVGGGENAEATPQLRYVPKSMYGMDLKLQQAWRIYVQDAGGRMMGSRMEWRDIPVEHHPR